MLREHQFGGRTAILQSLDPLIKCRLLRPGHQLRHRGIGLQILNPAVENIQIPPGHFRILSGDPGAEHTGIAVLAAVCTPNHQSQLPVHHKEAAVRRRFLCHCGIGKGFPDLFRRQAQNPLAVNGTTVHFTGIDTLAAAGVEFTATVGNQPDRTAGVPKLFIDVPLNGPVRFSAGEHRFDAAPVFIQIQHTAAFIHTIDKAALIAHCAVFVILRTNAIPAVTGEIALVDQRSVRQIRFTLTVPQALGIAALIDDRAIGIERTCRVIQALRKASFINQLTGFIHQFAFSVKSAGREAACILCLPVRVIQNTLSLIGPIGKAAFIQQFTIYVSLSLAIGDTLHKGAFMGDHAVAVQNAAALIQAAGQTALIL